MYIFNGTTLVIEKVVIVALESCLLRQWDEGRSNSRNAAVRAFNGISVGVDNCW